MKIGEYDEPLFTMTVADSMKPLLMHKGMDLGNEFVSGDISYRTQILFFFCLFQG